MRFAVEAWAPEYGTGLEVDLVEEATTPIDAGVEVPVGAWSPRRPAAPGRPPPVLFVDGVQRIDAELWVEVDEGSVRGHAASWAAGAVRCAPGEPAEVVAAEVRRGVLSPAPGLAPVATRAGTYGAVPVDPEAEAGLAKALHYQRSALEAEVTAAVGDGSHLLVADGRLRAGLEQTGAVGYVKAHHRAYLEPEEARVVAALGTGERTPLFLLHGRAPRLSWYLRLGGPRAHAWAGVVRLEVDGTTPSADAVEVADLVTALVPRYGSEAHKDGRAPQNLYPIAGLERHLRHLLGDRDLALRALRAAAA